ncbi:hypothetical protein VNO80_08696 [Phaseolus coccineus]|uniref:Uncharacterized protein n=1 Tax=Phaseolus coccineus TaxID=3886 RepID=A0AAN9NA83_PHACN
MAPKGNGLSLLKPVRRLLLPLPHFTNLREKQRVCRNHKHGHFQVFVWFRIAGSASLSHLYSLRPSLRPCPIPASSTSSHQRRDVHRSRGCLCVDDVGFGAHLSHPFLFHLLNICHQTINGVSLQLKQGVVIFIMDTAISINIRI